MVKYEGDLVFELDGASPVACGDIEFTGSVFASLAILPFTYDRLWRCEDDTVFQLTSWMGTAHVDDEGAFSLEIGTLDGTSPYGSYFGTAILEEQAAVPFVNAVGSDPSRIELADTLIGRLADGAAVTATGTVEVTPSSGSGTVTLVP